MTHKFVKDTYFSDYDSKSWDHQSQQRRGRGEKEAQVIQRHLAQVPQDDDFGVTWVKASAKLVLQIDKADPGSKEFD